MSEPSEPRKPDPPRELTGRIGKYEIKRSIGKGAMGQVYLAHDTILKRDVALKVMAAQIADDEVYRRHYPGTNRCSQEVCAKSHGTDGSRVCQALASKI